jgi:hypothetical protein
MTEDGGTHPIVLDYAGPPTARRYVLISFLGTDFSSEIIKAALLACFAFLVSALSAHEEPALTYATLVWIGAILACIVRAIMSRRESKKASKTQQNRWKWLVACLLLAAPLLSLSYSTCPHVRVLRIGSMRFESVTSPQGPCHNPRRFHPLIFIWFD